MSTGYVMRSLKHRFPSVDLSTPLYKGPPVAPLSLSEQNENDGGGLDPSQKIYKL